MLYKRVFIGIVLISDNRFLVYNFVLESTLLFRESDSFENKAAASHKMELIDFADIGKC